MLWCAVVQLNEYGHVERFEPFERVLERLRRRQLPGVELLAGAVCRHGAVQEQVIERRELVPRHSGHDAPRPPREFSRTSSGGRAVRRAPG
jgi:hypothetical protein